MKEFYRQTVKEVLDRVESSEAGLTSEQADHSREKCGWNELTEGKKKSISQIFFEQYKDFLVLILIASALISGILGDVESCSYRDRDYDQRNFRNDPNSKSGTIAAKLKEAFRSGSKGIA